MKDKEELLQLLAQAYCTEENKKKELDSTLLTAIADIIYPKIEQKIKEARLEQSEIDLESVIAKQDIIERKARIDELDRLLKEIIKFPLIVPKIRIISKIENRIKELRV